MDLQCTLWIVTAAHLVVLAELHEDVHCTLYLGSQSFHFCIMLSRVANKIRCNHDDIYQKKYNDDILICRNTKQIVAEEHI
jgi:hypothetical protein